MGRDPNPFLVVVGLGWHRDTSNPGWPGHPRTSPLTSLPPKLVRALSRECSLCLCVLTPAQLAQGLTHSLEEQGREDSQQEQQQQQELVHLSPGDRGHTRAGAGQPVPRRAGQAAVCADGRAWGLHGAAPGLWAEASSCALASGCFIAMQALEMFPQSQAPRMLPRAGGVLGAPGAELSCMTAPLHHLPKTKTLHSGIWRTMGA